MYSLVYGIFYWTLCMLFLYIVCNFSLLILIIYSVPFCEYKINPFYSWETIGFFSVLGYF